MNLLELTIHNYHQALRNGQVTTEALVTFYFDRIQRFDTKLASIISINPHALSQAKQFDQQFLSSKQLVGPLHGVPVLVKDNIETEEMPTTAGSLSLAGFCSGKDAYLVQRLRAAGAIILAKTNLHEFAIWGETISSVKGQTLNPYDLTRTPGGSSGGTGAALAANFGLVGIGTDTINSIRSPSSANSLVGIRPTMGLVSDDGIVPYSHTQDTAGPMARTVADAVTVLNVISANPPTPQDWTSGTDYVRLGILKSCFGQKRLNAEVNETMSDVLDHFLSLDVDLLEIKETIDISDLVANVSVHLFELVSDLDAYLKQPKAPVQSVQEILTSGLFHPGIFDNLLKARHLALDKREYKQRLKKRKALQAQIAQIMDELSLDAMIFPHQQQLVCKTGASQLQRNGALAAITGFPSICLPAGFSKPNENAPLGVPIGFELLGLPSTEAKLIKLASLFEQNFPTRIPPSETDWL